MRADIESLKLWPEVPEYTVEFNQQKEEYGPQHLQQTCITVFDFAEHAEHQDNEKHEIVEGSSKCKAFARLGDDNARSERLEVFCLHNQYGE